MDNKKRSVQLTDAERTSLEERLRLGQITKRKIKRAQILLLGDQGWTDDAIMQELDVSQHTIGVTRRLFMHEGMEEAIKTSPYQSAPKKMDAKAEAKLLELIRGAVPAGHKRWTLRLLAAKMVESGAVDKISYEGIRQYLEKRGLSLR